jgi:hypothetical protein
MKRLLILTLLLAACAKHAPARLDLKPIGSAEGKWSFVTNPDGKTAFVLVTDDEALKSAMKAMGCGVCTQEYIGEAYQIERIGK